MVPQRGVTFHTPLRPRPARWEPSPSEIPGLRPGYPAPSAPRALLHLGSYRLGPLRRFRSCCMLSRATPALANASSIRALTAGTKWRLRAFISCSLGSGTISPRRQASVSRVRLHPCPSGPAVAASRASHGKGALPVSDGTSAFHVPPHERASLRNLAPPLPAVSSALKALSSAVWASKAGMCDRVRRWLSDVREKDSR